jgi:hypothetical protein
MNLKQILLAGAASLLAASGVQAQDWNPLSFEPDSAIFSEKELSLDFFGFGSTHNRHGSGQGAWGPGVGVNYFLTENLGFGADTYADAFRAPYQLNASIIGRLPLGDKGLPGLAPYAYGGFGREWHYSPQWIPYIGAGVEYRFNAHTAAFTDLRGVFPLQTENAVVWRFGLRFVF